MVVADLAVTHLEYILWEILILDVLMYQGVS
jgi:hypothetical protein